MKPLCVICGRPTQPAVFLGAEPVGPVCAKNMGLKKGAMPRGGRVKFTAAAKPTRAQVPHTIELFPETL